MNAVGPGGLLRAAGSRAGKEAPACGMEGEKKGRRVRWFENICVCEGLKSCIRIYEFRYFWICCQAALDAWLLQLILQQVEQVANPTLS